jgi:SET domain-containing protein
MLDQHETVKYELQESGIHGKGVFAVANISKDEVIGIPLEVKYVVCIRITESLGKWINHSWNANTKLFKIDGQSKWQLKALDSIKKGTELTMDYRDTPWFIKKPSLWYK